METVTTVETSVRNILPIGMEFAEIDCSGMNCSLSEIDVKDLVPDMGT